MIYLSIVYKNVSKNTYFQYKIEYFYPKWIFLATFSIFSQVIQKKEHLDILVNNHNHAVATGFLSED